MATSKQSGRGRPVGRTVSMADVAAVAGVSQQTVSRVVNGMSNVNEKTRARVQAAMNELGFRPNFAGRSLRGGQYRTIGVCMFDIGRVGNLATLKGIAAAARENGYAITMIEFAPEEISCSLADAAQRMAALPVDAMVFNMNRMVTDFDEFVPLPGLRTVIMTMYEHPLCSTVDADQHGCSTMVVEHLLAHGHTQIRFIAGPEGSISGQFRERGWRDALAAHGIEPVEPLQGDWNADSGYEAGLKIADDPDATAVYAANDQMAYGCMMALQDRGLRVPEDISVVGVDDALEGTVPHNRLTSVRFDLNRHGRVVFDCALGETAASGQPQTIRIPGELIERQTVADRRL